MAYELYKRTSLRADSPSFTLSNGGRIGINAAAVRVMVEAGVKAVVLLWDKANNKIAIKAAPKNDENAYAVSLAPDNHSGNIRAKSFLAHIGWIAPNKLMLPAEWNEKEKMFELRLPPYPGAAPRPKIKVI